MFDYFINEEPANFLATLIDKNLTINYYDLLIIIAHKKKLQPCSITMTKSDCSTCIINDLRNLQLEFNKHSPQLILIKHIMHYSGITNALATITGNDIDLNKYKNHGFTILHSRDGTRDTRANTDNEYIPYTKHILMLDIDPWKEGYGVPTLKELTIKDL